MTDQVWQAPSKLRRAALAKGVLSEETRKRIADGKRKYPVFRARLANKLRQYGLDLTGYDRLMSSAEGRCDLCGGIWLLSVDHDHETGAVRGLVCRTCNRNLGWYEARKDRVKEYLGG